MAAEGEIRASRAQTQDATMVDVGEREKPPGDPPDAPMSWAKKVRGSILGGMPIPEEVLNDEFVAERLCLEFPDGEDGEPVITIGSEVLEAMNGLWKNCMLVKVLGRNVSLAVLSKKLREIWRPSGEMYVMDLPRQFFMVRFGMEEEYLAALTGGPWKVFGSYLMAQAWAPEFDPMRDEITTTPVWVRLSSIPVNFYHKTILMGIAKGLGKPIKVDMTTLNFERARFARVCVEVNLKKPLKGTVMINGARYYVSYEGLMSICSCCGMYGHLVHNCPNANIEKAAVIHRSLEKSVNELVAIAPPTDGFTMVGRSGRPVAQQRARIAEHTGKSGGGSGNIRRDLVIRKDLGNISLSNSFGKLREDLSGPEMRDVIVSSDENKENENVSNQLQIPGRGPQVVGIKFGANFGKNKGGSRGITKEKRAGVIKGVDGSGPKPKHQKQNRPMRGLVFGPSREELQLSESGKRLRLEKSNPGRAGGYFVNDREQTTAALSLEQSSMVVLGVNDLTEGQGLEPMEEALRIAPAVSGDGNCDV